MLRLRSMFFALLGGLACTQVAVGQLPALSAQTMEAYQTAIEPTDEESAFLKIDWLSQLHLAVQRAHREEKPLLIYVMNGHPLACT